MSSELELAGVDGTTPLGFLAAIGLLRVLSETTPASRLAWRYRGTWVPVMYGTAHSKDLAGLILKDAHSPSIQAILSLRYPKVEKGGIKTFSGLHPPVGLLRAWLHRAIKEKDLNQLSMIAGLMCETAADEIDKDKRPLPSDIETGCDIDYGRQDALARAANQTSFDFTSKNQQFLDQLRVIVKSVTRDHICSDLFTGTGGISIDRTMGWDSREDRPGALFPSSECRRLPVHEWLAFRALSFFPVFGSGDVAKTTACDGRRKKAKFRWCVWSSPISCRSLASLIHLMAVAAEDRDKQRALGIESAFVSEMTKGADGYSGVFLPATPT